MLFGKRPASAGRLEAATGRQPPAAR